MSDHIKSNRWMFSGMGPKSIDYVKNLKTNEVEKLLTDSMVRRMTGLSSRQIGTLLRLGEFPRPTQINSNQRRWTETEILAWIKDGTT